MHIANILKDKELYADSVVKEFLTTAADGKNYSGTGDWYKKKEKIFGTLKDLSYLCPKIRTQMKESKPYPRIDEEDGKMLTASEPVAATAMAIDYAQPEDVDYANIVDGTLQVTSGSFMTNVMEMTLIVVVC